MTFEKITTPTNEKFTASKNMTCKIFMTIPIKKLSQTCGEKNGLNKITTTDLQNNSDPSQSSEKIITRFVKKLPTWTSDKITTPDL